MNRSLEVGSPAIGGELRGTLFFDLLADPAAVDVAGPVLPCGDAPVHDCELALRAADGRRCRCPSTARRAIRRWASRWAWWSPAGRGRAAQAYSALRQAHDDLKRTQQQLLHPRRWLPSGGWWRASPTSSTTPSASSSVTPTPCAATPSGWGISAAVHGRRPGGHPADLRERLRIDRIPGDLDPPRPAPSKAPSAPATSSTASNVSRRSTGRDARFDLRVVGALCHLGEQGPPERFEVTVDIPGTACRWWAARPDAAGGDESVQNAADATAGQPTARPRITGSIEGDVAVLRFHDNGRASSRVITPHLRPLLHYQAGGRGTGLGLSISGSIAERHGERAAGGNHPDGGAETVLRLPWLEPGA